MRDFLFRITRPGEKSKGLRPDFIAGSVEDIDFKTIAELGVLAVAFDVDMTLVGSSLNDIDSAKAVHLKNIVQNAGILEIYIATNSPRNVSAISDALGVKSVIQPGSFMKPQKRFYRQIEQKSGLEPNQIAMVGDKIIQDVFGANHAGLYSVAIEAHLPGPLPGRITKRNIWQPKLLKLLSKL